MSNAITYYRGDTALIRVTVRDSLTLAPIDITGKTLKLTVDPSENPLVDTANLVQLTGALEDPANGVATFTPQAGDMG